MLISQRSRWAALALALLLSGIGAEAAAQTRFRFPANGTRLYFRRTPTVHVDHDPTVGEFETQCVDYGDRGFPWCYDGHKGTDYLLVFGFGTMDQYDVEVVAAADGEVIAAVDGNYDRCHASGMGEVSCDGNPMQANSVDVRHADGIVSRYIHLKKGSVKVKVGEQVTCGQVLGYVGSSGRSAFPHLHFQVEDAQGGIIDPYAGPKSQPTSYWLVQEGPLGWPDDLCPGETRPPDGGVVSDAGPPAGDGTALPSAASGCGVAGLVPGDGLAALILLALAGWLSRRRAREASRGPRP